MQLRNRRTTGARQMDAKGAIFGICLTACLMSCAAVKITPQGISICDVDMPSLKSGDSVRIAAIYSASSMHPAVLYGRSCVNNGVQTYGYEEARGGASASFRDQLARDSTRVNVVEYEIDVGGVIERDEDGEWLKAKTIFSWREIKKKASE